MSARKPRSHSRWLLGVGTLVLIALAVVAAQGHVAASQAAPTGPALHTEPASPLSIARVEAADTDTMTITLPYVVRNFSRARLSVTKSAFPTSFIAGPGQIVTYTVTISNVGGTTGVLQSIVDTLPAGFQFHSMSPASDVTASPDGTTGTIAWTGSWTMAPGDELTLVYLVTAGQVPGQYTNQVSVTAAGAHVPDAPAQATVTVQSSVLLQENFNAGIDAWTPFLNHHRLEPGQWYYGVNDGTGGSGALTHDCNTGTLIAADALMMYLQPGAEEWTDYRVETNMYLTGGMDKYGNLEPTGGDPIGLWIRGQYEDGEFESQWVSGYYVVLVGGSTSTSHHIRIAKMQQPGDCEACLKPFRMYNFDNPMEKATSESLPGPFEHYRWYHLAVEVRGANIKVFLDNELVLDWTDPLLPFMSGTVGLKVHETKNAMFDDLIVVPLESGR